MAEPYTVLAPVYKTAGLADASEALRHRIFQRLQSDGWLGRRILELGCGIGEASCWFSETGFRVMAVDQSAAMLAEARKLAEARNVVAVDWIHSDMLALQPETDFDLVLCLDTLNEIRSIRDLETVFQIANRALTTGKTFVFDLVTMQGLVEGWGNVDRVLYDDPDSLMVLVRSRFSFESAANTRAYIIYRETGECLVREDETHVLRGYALQAVGTLLQRTGFKVQNVVNPDYERFDPYNDRTGRAIFIAVKE
ncbi:MAG: class I SAM-dependent methyltransferase [Anaerolineae bacterium]|nr:class I SAM-dependent methyltransferase [Anaerolineae bacterium]